MFKLQQRQHPQTHALQINTNVKLILNIIFTTEHFNSIHFFGKKDRFLYMLRNNEKNI